MVRRLLSVVVCIAIAGAMPSIAGQLRGAREIGWVGLYNAELLEHLDSVNRMRELCAPAVEGSEAYDACRRARMAPKTIELRLFAGPSETARSTGVIRLVATPGEPLAAFFVPSAGGAPRPIQPDLYDPDWGYGPYFHETYLDRRGPWFLLPEEPFPRGSWFDSRALTSEPMVHTLQPGDIVTTPRRDLYIIDIGADGVRARLEQPADMWCEDGPAPPLKPFREILVPSKDLYSATGHLVIHIKYTRGC